MPSSVRISLAQRGLMNAVGALVGTLRVLPTFIARNTSIASNKALAAGAALRLSTSRNSCAYRRKVA